MHKQPAYFLSYDLTTSLLPFTCFLMFCHLLPAFLVHSKEKTYVVRPLVNGTKAAINALLVSPGEHFQKLPSVIADLEEYGVHTPSDSKVESFKKFVYTKYLNRLYAKLIYANNRLTAKLILKDIAASTKRLCTAFVYNSQGSNGVQIISKLFKHYKLLTKGRLAVRYAKTIHKSLKA